MDIARTILDQLGGNRFVMLTGCNSFVGDKDTLRMSIPRNYSKANRLWITLNEKDLYDMRFFRFRRGHINRNGEFIPEKIDEEKVYSDIYFDQLQEVFTRHTHLYTHF